jgi:hypothetical protein
VIYFDIGLRNPASDFQLVLEQRCHYVKINWTGDLQDQIRQVLGEASNRRSLWESADLASFSIANQSSSKLPSVFEALYESLG